MKKPKTRCAIQIASAALVVVLFLRYGVTNFVLKTVVSSKIKLAPGNDVWNIWSEMPIPMYSKFYFFNVTNPDKVMEGAKPILKEMGPYVYQEHRQKIILESNDETVKYRPKITYMFRPELSYGSQDDKVTLLNVPYVAVAKIAWDVSKEPFMLSTLDDILSAKGESLFHTNRVREFLFDGFSIENYMELFSLPVEAFGVKTEIPARILDGDFGFFDDRNGTAEEIWTVGTGIRDKQNLGKIVSWNGKSSLDGWSDERCNKIDDSTDGTIFPPVADTSRILDVFHPDACRSLQMSYVGPGEFIEIPTHRYSFASNTFESLDLHPENECFCKETYEWCKKGGVFPLWPCVGGAPVFISRPHFMNSHVDYRKAVDGLNENGDYSSVIDVEPTIGLAIRADMKLQVNIELQSFGSMATFINVPNLMFPVFWMEETAELTEELAKPLKWLTIGLLIADSVIQLIVIGCLAIILIAVGIEAKNSNWLGKCCG
ncbi:Sensory neuron membrane protein 1, partial [Orchesella cincta]